MIAISLTQQGLVEARNWGQSMLADSDALMAALDRRLAEGAPFAILLDFLENDGTSENHPEQAMRHMRWMEHARDRMSQLCAGVVYVTATEKLSNTLEKKGKAAERMWAAPIFV